MEFPVYANGITSSCQWISQFMPKVSPLPVKGFPSSCLRCYLLMAIRCDCVKAKGNQRFIFSSSPFYLQKKLRKKWDVLRPISLKFHLISYLFFSRLTFFLFVDPSFFPPSLPSSIPSFFPFFFPSYLPSFLLIIHTYDTMLDPEDKLTHDSYGQFLIIFHNN